MSDEYTPPTPPLPFNFTERGYEAPNSTELLFNFAPTKEFGVLKAAINVVSPYWYETHTYPKSCPKYVIGYGSGRVQIIKGRCIYGGIRDLQGIITALPVEYSTADLPAEINGRPPFSTDDLSASIKLWVRGALKDLPSAIYGLGSGDLHARLKVYQTGTKDLPADLHGWQTSDLGMTLAGTHDPENLRALIRVNRQDSYDLSGAIHAWHERFLSASLGTVYPNDLNAFLQAVPPKDLPAYIKTWPQDVLPASTYGWQSSDLGGYIKRIYDSFLPARIFGISDVTKDLAARIKGYALEVQEDLPASIRSFHIRDLPGIVRATYLQNITAYLFPVVPKILNARIHVWHERYLQGILNGQDYPWNLTAEIYPKGSWRLLEAQIVARKAREIYDSLTASARVWELRNLAAIISGEQAPILTAYINPLGMGADLHASIYPKMIRLTTLVNVSTMAGSDLSAIINYPCFYTGYSSISAYVYGMMKSDLMAYIRPIQYDYKPALLSAKIGFSDSYLEVDKLNLGITIYPGRCMVEDKLRFNFSILRLAAGITASIRGTLRYKDLSSYIVAEPTTKFTYDHPIKNREKVVHKTYNGVFQQFEYVEMAFKSIVKDYFYSSDGDYAWKKDRFEKWMLDVKSYLPTDLSLRLNRRLHRATTLYDLRKFDSVDDAMKFAIAYVTEYPQSDLSATIYNRGRYAVLTGSIVPKFPQHGDAGLSSSITPIGTQAVISTDSSVLKI